MEAKSKNLIFFGIKESEADKEDSQSLIKKLAKDTLGVENLLVDMCYRLGRKDMNKGNHKSRPVFVKFAMQREKERVWQQRAKLKGTHITVKEDLPEETEGNISRLLPILKAARNQDLKASLKKDLLVIEGEKYNVNNLYKLPQSTCL
jgi:hypothetical protein